MGIGGAGIIGLGIAGVYYAVAYGLLGFLKVKQERKFLFATIPLVVFGVVWIISALVYNSWGGVIIAVMLLLATGLVWIIKRIM